MLLNEAIENKWKTVLDAEGTAPIKDSYRRAVTALVLENMANEMVLNNSVNGRPGMLEEVNGPTNTTGANISNYDPILISLVRRALPNLIAYDFCGVQPMTGPTGLIFAMRSRYQTGSGTEALFNEADTTFSANANTVQTGNATQVGNDPVLNTSNSSAYTIGNGMPTSVAEALGSIVGTNDFAEMAFDIEKVTVTARSRALKATYSMELAQDLKAIHGLDAETELANILSTEILAELNREVIRSVYRTASLGCTYGTTTSGTFDLDVDSNGRWAVEKFKGLVFQIERECNAIAKATRRGKGNVIIVSSDIASALQMTGILSYPNPGYQADLTVDDTGNTFAGTMHGGRVKVFIDPYFGGSANGDELVTVGYKGTSPYDAGLFYCPYVPLQMVRAVGQDNFQPRIGFKTRYGMVANPFATAAGDGVVGDRNVANQSNIYYRIFRVTNLL